MQMTLSEITNKLARAAENFVKPDEAQYFAEVYLKSHLKKAPRMAPLQEAIDDLKNWRKVRSHRIETLIEKPGIQLFDFAGLAPSLKIKMLHDILEQKAKANGVACVGFRNSAGVITLGMWADGLADRGLMALVVFNGGMGCTTPIGGRKGVLGTNPLAFAVPSDKGPITLDMATSEIPYFQIKNAKEKGESLPPGSAVDNDGLPTQNPNLALDKEGVSNLLPMGGGFKGYGLMILVEILSGSLVQSIMSHEQTPGWNPQEYGCFILALDPGSFGEADRFNIQVAALGDFLRAQRPATNSRGVAVPGDRGLDKIKQVQKDGELELDPKLIAAIEKISA